MTFRIPDNVLKKQKKPLKFFRDGVPINESYLFDTTFVPGLLFILLNMKIGKNVRRKMSGLDACIFPYFS